MSFEMNYLKILIATKTEVDPMLYSICVKNINVYNFVCEICQTLKNLI